MKKIYYNKLIRDKIPEKIHKRGSNLLARKLSLTQFKKELLKKVGEEASSLPKLKAKKAITEELADIIDVIDEIKKVKGIKAKEITRAQRLNQKKKGGFKKKTFSCLVIR